MSETCSALRSPSHSEISAAEGSAPVLSLRLFLADWTRRKTALRETDLFVAEASFLRKAVISFWIP